ncbi:MAG: Gfo/Idh/MocA family oxidoreductase [Armatimonadetes bacterium]|nr:Gfo/Idh/MocA family oxidoreductase [Armatimonadota bacterium]
MSEQVGFVTMGAARAGETAAPVIGVGMLGYAFMGKAHTNAFKKIPYVMWPPPAVLRLVAIAGRSEEAVREAQRRYGYEKAYTDWRQLVEDPDVQLFDNGGPNDTHAEPCIAAARAGKHILCEKPLARTAAEAKAMLDAVEQAGVKHACAFNYRFVPAVCLARNLIEEGKLGEIYHFRARYLQEWIMDPNFPRVWRLNRAIAGSGALGDLGAHIIDLGRYLVGEIGSVMATARTFIKERPSATDPSHREPVDVDDAFEAVVEFENGAVGTLEASRFCAGRKNYNTFEINGSRGSIVFNLEDMNRLQVYFADEKVPETAGFHNVLVSESYHPYWNLWWPHGHIIGWEHTFVHEIGHLLEAIVHNESVAPYGATFRDGYRNAVICDAILQSAAQGRRVACVYEA